MTRPSHSTSRATTMLALLVGTFSAAQAATFPVSNLNDSGSGSLRAAITSANATAGADVVDATSLSGTINIASPLPSLSTPVSIRGAGVDKLTLARSASATYRLFSVSTGVSVSVSGLTLSGGGGNLETGGAISNGGTLNLSGCTLTENTARRGGAIYSTGTLNIESCTFLLNPAASGGAILSQNGFLNASNSTFQFNFAAGDGGALSLLQTRTSLQNCTFAGNQASNTGNGGAVFFLGRFDLSRPGLAVTNCTFSGNSAGKGGALWNSGAALQLQNTTVADNTASSGSGVWSAGDANTLSFASNSIIAGNSASPSSIGDDVASGTGKNTFVSRGFNLIGGGNSRASFNKTGDKTGLTRNQLLLGALASNGGPTLTILPLAGSPAVDAIPTSSLGVPVDQRGKTRPQGSAGDIGSVEVGSVGTQPQTGSTILVNTPDEADDGVCTTDNCTLREAINTANARTAGGSTQTTTIAFDPKVFSAPQSIGVGQTPDSNLFFSTALVLTGRLKIVGPGANLLSIVGAGDVRQFQIQTSAQVSISGVTLSGGAPFRARGGAIVNAGTLEISDCILKNNASGGGSGGAIANDGALSVRACTFEFNSNGATGLNSSGTGAERRFGGGAIYNGGTLSARNSTFSYNRDSANGGGRSGGGAIFNEGTATIENCAIDHCASTVRGAGLCSQSSGTLTVVSCSISINSVSGSPYFSGSGAGSGIHSQGPLVLRNSLVAFNIDGENNVSGSGGVWISGPTASIDNCTITQNGGGRNSSGQYLSGRGILIRGGVATVKNSVVADNNTGRVELDVVEMGGQLVSVGYNLVGFAGSEQFNATGDQKGGYSADGTLKPAIDPKFEFAPFTPGASPVLTPRADSPLINAGDPAFNTATLPFDQRGPGFPRVVGARIDIGAFETQTTAAKTAPPKSATKPSGGAS